METNNMSPDLHFPRTTVFGQPSTNGRPALHEKSSDKLMLARLGACRYDDTGTNFNAGQDDKVNLKKIEHDMNSLTRLVPIHRISTDYVQPAPIAEKPSGRIQACIDIRPQACQIGSTLREQENKRRPLAKLHKEDCRTTAYEGVARPIPVQERRNDDKSNWSQGFMASEPQMLRNIHNKRFTGENYTGQYQALFGRPRFTSEKQFAEVEAASVAVKPLKGLCHQHAQLPIRDRDQPLGAMKHTISRDETQKSADQERQVMQTIAMHIKRDQGTAHEWWNCNYDHGPMHKQEKHKRVTRNAREWEKHKSIIHSMYMIEGMGLSMVQSEMERLFSFRASKRMYDTIFRKWGFRRVVVVRNGTAFR